jgi:hypothetical protein
MPYTYTTLFNDVVANMEEDSAEFVSALPSIIERAQSYLQRRVDPIAIIRYSDVTVSASNRLLTLPSDVLVLKSLQLTVDGMASNLVQQTNEYLTAYWPNYTSVSRPKYFAAKDNAEVFLAPTPDVNGTATIEYIPKVTILSSAAPANWFSQNAEVAFFSAAMMYSNAWTKNAEAINTWKAQTDEELAVLNNEARRSRRSDTSDRTQGTPENNIGDGQR